MNAFSHDRGGPSSSINNNLNINPPSVMNIIGGPGSIYQDHGPASVGPNLAQIPMTPLQMTAMDHVSIIFHVFLFAVFSPGTICHSLFWHPQLFHKLLALHLIFLCRHFKISSRLLILVILIIFYFLISNLRCTIRFEIYRSACQKCGIQSETICCCYHEN